jgi:hypothetical protein
VREFKVNKKDKNTYQLRFIDPKYLDKIEEIKKSSNIAQYTMLAYVNSKMVYANGLKAAQALFHDDRNVMAVDKDGNEYIKDKKILFGLDLVGCEQSKYTCMTAPDMYFNYIKNNPNTHVYEIFEENRPMYYPQDIDIPFGKNGIDTTEKSIEHVKKIIRHTVDKFKNLTQNFEVKFINVVVLMSEPELSLKDSNKYSFHVVYRGPYRFKDIHTVKEFHNRLVLEDINGIMDEVTIDKSIYGANKALRCAFTTKDGKQAKLLPITLTMGEKDYTFLGNKRDDRFFNRALATYMEREDPHQNTIKFKGEESNSPNTKSKYKKHTLTEEEVRADNEKAYENMVKADTNIEEIIYNLAHANPDIVEEYSSWNMVGQILYKLGHMRNQLETYKNLFLEWSTMSSKGKRFRGKNQSIWYGYKRSLSKPIHIGWLMNRCREYNIAFSLHNKTNLPAKIANCPARPVYLDKSPEKVVEVDKEKLDVNTIKTTFIGHDNMFIQSEKGTGKTTNMLKYIFGNESHLSASEKILFVTSKRTLAAKLLEDLEMYGFRHYEQIDWKNTPRVTRLICQVDSLHKVKIVNYDAVILDECESLSRYMCEEHFAKGLRSSESYRSFVDCLKYSKYLIGLDADLSQPTLNYYMELRQAPPKQIVPMRNKYKVLVNNKLPYSDYTISIIEKWGWVAKVLEFLADNKKIVIPTTSKAWGKAMKMLIRRKFPNKKIEHIDSDTSDDDKIARVRAVNKIWSEVDVVIYSPSISTGVSFDITGHFDYIMGYGCSRSVSGQEFCQMLHRVRSPINKNIFVTLDRFSDYTSIDNDVTVDKLIEADKIVFNNLCQYTEDMHMDEIGDLIRKIKYDQDDSYYKILTYCKRNKFLNEHSFQATLFGYIKTKGYSLDYPEYDKETAHALCEEMKNIGKKIKEDLQTYNCNLILQSKTLTQEEYNEIMDKQSNMRTEVENGQIARYLLMQTYNLDNDEVTETVVRNYNDPKKKVQYQNLIKCKETQEQTQKDKLDTMARRDIRTMAKHSEMFEIIHHASEFMKHKLVLDAIEMLGFNLQDMTITQDLETFTKAIDETVEYVYKNRTVYSSVLKKTSLTVNRTKDNMATKLRYVNSIFNISHGVKVRTHGTEAKRTYKLEYSTDWGMLPEAKRLVPKHINEFTAKEQMERDIYEEFINQQDDDSDDEPDYQDPDIIRE